MVRNKNFSKGQFTHHSNKYFWICQFQKEVSVGLDICEYINIGISISYFILFIQDVIGWNYM